MLIVVLFLSLVASGAADYYVKNLPCEGTEYNGTCQDAQTPCEGGYYEPGLCSSAPSGFQCCLPTPKCQAEGFDCVSTSDFCDGYNVPYGCPTSTKCCVHKNRRQGYIGKQLGEQPQAPTTTMGAYPPQ